MEDAMAVDAASIHRFFETYGWHYDYKEDSATWHTGFRGDTANFNIFVHLTDNWLYFTITPFVNAPVDPECEQKLNRFLLRLNHAINMAKFSLDSDGDVVLTVELPTENLDYSEFADGLNALSFYADAHYLDILNAAQNRDFEPSLTPASVTTEPDEEPEEQQEAEGEEGEEGERPSKLSVN
jgi:hypothetical protein